MTTLDYLFRRVIPTASDLLPEEMRSPQAAAMLMAIALQESGAAHRRQVGGPARGFWQFEVAGVRGVRLHPWTQSYISPVLLTLSYPPLIQTPVLQEALADNDVLACVFVRLLLWTLPEALPSSDIPAEGWRQYLAAWRPGKPHATTWRAHYDRAWQVVNAV